MGQSSSRGPKGAAQPTEGSRLVPPEPAPRRRDEQRRAPSPPPSNALHDVEAGRHDGMHHQASKHTLVYHNVVDHETKDEEADEESSWAGATVKYTALAIKGVIASIFTLVSAYVAVDGWSTMDFSNMNTFKTLMFALSTTLTLPQLYQTMLITLTFTAVARGAIVEELKQRRPPLLVFFYSAILVLFVPFVLPFLMLVGIIFQPVLYHFKIVDFWIVIVGLIDFCQTLVLIPLAYVVIFSADSATDIFIDIVAVQVFATLDDEFVRAFSNPSLIKREALETYCEKGDGKHHKGDGKNQ